MRIITQRIDESTEVCPRLGLILADGLFVGSKIVRHVFLNSPCDRSSLLSHDVIVHANRLPLDDIHRVDFNDRRRTDLDFEIWRSFRHYRMTVHVEPEPFAPIGRIVELAKVFVAECPPLPITFKNPDSELLDELVERFGRRTRTRSPKKGRP